MKNNIISSSGLLSLLDLVYRLNSIGTPSQQGLSGTSNTMPIDPLKEIMNKYKRFLISRIYDSNTFMIQYKIIDNINNKEYNIKPNSMIIHLDELENYLIQIITDTRQEIINTVIND